MRNVGLQLLFYIFLVTAQNPPLEALFTLHDGKVRAAIFDSLASDTVYLHTGAGTQIVRRVFDKRFFRKVVFKSGDSLDLRLRDYPVKQKPADEWGDLGVVQRPAQPAGIPAKWSESAEKFFSSTATVAVILRNGDRLVGKLISAPGSRLALSHGGDTVAIDQESVSDMTIADTLVDSESLPESDSGLAVILLLSSGDRLAGRIVSATEGRVILDGAGGTVTVPKADITAILPMDRTALGIEPDAAANVRVQPALPVPPVPVMPSPAAPVPISAPPAMTGLVIPDSVCHDEPAQEAGAYERKSISYINLLWLLDDSSKAVGPKRTSTILAEIKKNIMMKRFDYNPLPGAWVTALASRLSTIDFQAVESLSALRSVVKPGGKDWGRMLARSVSGVSDADIGLDTITSCIREILGPSIVAAVTDAAMERAANLRSEAQRNSFAVDKAKQLGITMCQLQKVMNASYVFMPVMRNFRRQFDKKEDMISCEFDLGIIWFRVLTTGGQVRVAPVVKSWTSTSGFAKPGRRYITAKGFLTPDEYAFETALANGCRNLLVATQDIPEFRLSTQIMNRQGGSIYFDLSRHDGLHVDDKYTIAEFFEQEDGTIRQQNNGWVKVNGVADSGKQSRGGVISGNPSHGTVLSEFPRLPLDVSLAFLWTMYDVENIEVGAGSFGYTLEAMYNLGRHFGWRQLFMGFSTGNGWGIARGKVPFLFDSLDVGHAEMWHFDLALTQKIYLRRFVLFLRPAFRFETIKLIKNELKFENGAHGFSATGGFEIALSQEYNLRLEGGYRFLERKEEDGYHADHGGMLAGASLIWSPPSLPFDPWNLVRAKIGL